MLLPYYAAMLFVDACRSRCNKQHGEERRVCELQVCHVVVYETQHIEGDISANRLLQHYLRIPTKPPGYTERYPRTVPI